MKIIKINCLPGNLPPKSLCGLHYLGSLDFLLPTLSMYSLHYLYSLNSTLSPIVYIISVQYIISTVYIISSLHYHYSFIFVVHIISEVYCL